MLTGMWRQSYPTWFMIHVRNATGLPASSTDALLCRCKRRKKTFATPVVLAHNGTASFDFSIRFKATLFSGPVNTKIRKKEFKIELKAVDCCSPGRTMESSRQHVHYESVIDLAAFAEDVPSIDTILHLTRTSTSDIAPEHIVLVISIYSSRTQSDLIGEEHRRWSTAPRLALNTFSSPQKTVKSVSSGNECAADDEGDVCDDDSGREGTKVDGESNLQSASANASVTYSRSEGFDNTTINSRPKDRLALLIEGFPASFIASSRQLA